MAIKQVELPLYRGLEEDKEQTVIIREFGGKLIFTICDKDKATARFECYLDDIQRAWQAVRRP